MIGEALEGVSASVIAVTDWKNGSISSIDGNMSPALTGQFDTAQLPRLAPDPVTVIVARSIAPGGELDFLEWANELISVVQQAAGCLGAAVFHPGAAGGEYQIVVRFVDGLTLRAWERSKARNDLMERADRFVQTTRVQRTVGVDAWFEAGAHARAHRPWWRRLFVDVAWVYPLSMAVSVFVAPRLGSMPLPLRVLVGAALITLVLQALVSPARNRIRARRRL